MNKFFIERVYLEKRERARLSSTHPPLLLRTVALIGGLPALVLAFLLDALLFLVGGGARARVDTVAATLFALAAFATTSGGLVGWLLQVPRVIVPVPAELSFSAFVLRKRKVFDVFVKALAGIGDGQQGHDQQEG